jgi:hypothetical protein
LPSAANEGSTDSLYGDNQDPVAGDQSERGLEKCDGDNKNRIFFYFYGQHNISINSLN